MSDTENNLTPVEGESLAKLAGWFEDTAKAFRGEGGVTVCVYCPDAAARTAFYEERGITVSHGSCQPCRARLRSERLERRGRIAAAVVMSAKTLPPEDVASVACRIDEKLEALTLATLDDAPEVLR